MRQHQLLPHPGHPAHEPPGIDRLEDPDVTGPTSWSSEPGVREDLPRSGLVPDSGFRIPDSGELTR